MRYDEKKGYGLQFTKFDEQYEDSIIYRETKEGIIRLADIIINSFDRGSLMEELNTMQAQSYMQQEDGSAKMPEIFENKFEIPAYFINLILEKYHMKLLGW
jgi:hypothetical protein